MRRARLLLLVALAGSSGREAFALGLVQPVGDSGATQAVSSKPGSNQYMLGSTFLFTQTESKQGSESLAGGRTLYGQVNLQYNLVNWFSGFGLVLNHERIGDNQVNEAVGVKGELTWAGYYVDVAYGIARQTFQHRAVSSRKGTALSIGGGIRVPFLQEFLYFDGGVRQRTVTYDLQDGASLRTPIEETVLMPFIGFGLSLYE